MVNAPFSMMHRIRQGIPYVVSGGECVRVDDDFLDEPSALSYEDGDLNGAGLDSVCEAGYTLVHEEGNGVEGFFLSEDVVEDNCAQFCVPDFVLGMLSDEDQPVLPGSCEDAGYLEHVAQTTTSLIPGSPLTTVVDVYDRGDDGGR